MPRAHVARPERRRRRASTAPEALRLYLETVADARELSAVVLCDDTGWLVGAARRDLDLQRIASLGRWCAEGFDATEEELTATGGEDLYAHTLHVGARRLFLTSLGARVARVRDVAETAARILG
jgi:hypothetical protein